MIKGLHSTADHKKWYFSTEQYVQKCMETRTNNDPSHDSAKDTDNPTNGR